MKIRAIVLTASEFVATMGAITIMTAVVITARVAIATTNRAVIISTFNQVTTIGVRSITVSLQKRSLPASTTH
jgi:hypothetical protein